MAIAFREALETAKAKYPHAINHYEEYEDYFVFDRDDGVEHVGGDFSPVVIRKSDGATLNYEPIFFNLDAEAEDVGEPLSVGSVSNANLQTSQQPTAARSVPTSGT